MKTTTVKHTPGPWTVMERDSVGDNIFTVSTPIRRIANTYGSTEVYEANARLVAAAPELLEALEGIVAEWNAGGIGRIARPKGGVPQVGIAKALEAIAKARGV